LHFGLGTATQIDRIEVLWPSGLHQVVGGPTVDRIVRLTEGETTLQPFTVEAHKK
jgi:hypothetical protein